MQSDEPFPDGGSSTTSEPAARVLVAEDDPELRRLITATLRKGGFDVLEAADGIALLDQVGEVLLNDQDFSKLDIIVSDVRMPGWSGLDVLAGLVHANCRVPVVFITAYADDRTRRVAASLGAKAVLQKPVDLDDLCTAVSRILLDTRAERTAAPVTGKKGGRHAT